MSIEQQDWPTPHVTAVLADLMKFVLVQTQRIAFSDLEKPLRSFEFIDLLDQDARTSIRFVVVPQHLREKPAVAGLRRLVLKVNPV